ncbi:alpha/beta-hydrolase [Coprinopsis marcescibilis]|uniref:Alpha/beta-hydrolase n=1 Tax=Coprinopsis marcescibilis TaxID=230819 RepID=A0A5C3L216_COPMA|nr:alpha/beta-hydrolase [Coprinopsis marcescibilis]
MPLSTVSSLIPRVFTRRQATLASEPTSQLVRRSPTEALFYYSTPGIAPPSARIDPKLKIPSKRPLRFWEYWKFAAVAATKATHVTSEVLSHTIWGPRKKSWGIEMTIITSLIREIERHANLVDIDLLRMAMSLTGLAPVPSDALVTPVTFLVRKRKLRGILAEYDALETGTRELYGEWVVGRQTWERLQHEWKSGNRAEGDSRRTPPKRKERVILYIHGGAYYLSSAAAQRIFSIPLAKWADARVFALDYRLAPETCFPGPLHDAVSAYLRLVEDLRIPPENIILAGDSAGGGLCLGLLLYLRDNDYALPSAAILMSPWCDLTLSCESWDLNAPFDVVPLPSSNNHLNPIAMYLGERMEEFLTHPYASPLFGDMRGLPPLLIQAGEAEVLRDEITLLAHKASLAGVEVIHELYEDCIHIFQAYPFLDASKQAFVSMRNFVKHILPQIQSRSPQLLPSIAEQGLEKEMERNTAIIVSGDGLEMSSCEDQLKYFEAHTSTNDSQHSSDTDDDKEVPSSWTRSPAWSRTHSVEALLAGSSRGSKGFASKGKGSDTGTEIIEDATALEDDDIPIMDLKTSDRDEPPLVPVSRSRPRARSTHSPIIGPQPSRPQPRQQRSYNALRASGLAMSTVQPPPAPAIRRSAKSSSHPDLTSLVNDWSREGPANCTYMYPANMSSTHSS